MAEIKTKFMDLLHKQTNRQIKIPAMGFSEYLMQSLTASDLGDDQPGFSRTPQHRRQRLPSKTIHLEVAESIGTDKDADTVAAQATEPGGKLEKCDQEILESIDSIYFRTDNSPVELLVLKKVLDDGVNYDLINSTIAQLRQQHKVLSKQVLQNILEQRGACNAEFSAINATRKELEESLWICRKSRSYLNYAKTHLTTISLEILASYRKREILKDLLNTLQSIKKLKFTDIEVEKLLSENNYSGAIALLLDCKDSASEFMQYNCVQSLHKKLQETLLMTEYQLDVVLNELVFDFNIQKYAKLQEAYKLLNKSLMAMDQLHINFISAIHSSVNSVLRGYIENDANSTDENVKYLYEQLCEQIKSKQYISCLISLCKTFWTILASYYQIVIWHQNYKLYPVDSQDSPDLYIQEKLKKGQSRIWNDILTKICIYLQSSTLITLKYDQFIQVLAIIQRLKKVGIEFCGEHSEKVIEIIRLQSEKFFQCYHIACLEEICLFLDNESWTIVDSFTNILQLAEFRCISHTFKRQKTLAPPSSSSFANDDSPVSNQNCDDLVSVQSQDASSSIYASYGYFLRFSEKSSPFDGGLDVTMLEEDILSGIVDEASCYFSEESEDERKSLHSKDGEEDTNNQNALLVNNTALNVFRCIGRYLQMCKLLHCISPKIVASMLELMDFYIYAVYEMFAKDSIISIENLYSAKLEEKIENVKRNLLPNIKIWPINFSSLLNNELANPDTLYGLSLRVVAVASLHCISQQFQLLLNYLNHLLHQQDRFVLNSHSNYLECTKHLGRLIYSCITTRALDLPATLAMISKVKWNINHVSFQHNNYIDIMNRNVQSFAMRLEEIVKEIDVPIEQLWNSVACVASHVFVEGFSNVRKCSAGGRALMQLDFTNFMSLLELISNQKFAEYRSYVDTFIKVYYFSFENLEEWVRLQNNMEPSPQYTKKQIVNLIHCMCANDKRTKQKLLNLLDVSSSNSNSNNNNNNSNPNTTFPDT